MSKLGNTLAMLKILETGRKYSVKELSEMLEVSPRMIKEYKAALDQAGIYIDTVYGVYGGYVYNSKNNYDVTFNFSDLQVLERVIGEIRPQDRDDFEHLVEKIRTIVIYSDYKNDVDEEDVKESNKKYNMISKAIKEGKSIIIIHKGKENVFQPHTVSFYKDYIYFTGFSENDQDLRTYNLNEINLK